MLLSHAKIELYFHLVIVTKTRVKVLDDKSLDIIKQCFETVSNSGYGLQIVEANIDREMPDHCHILIEATKIQGLDLSKFITSFKSMTSRKLKTIISGWQGWSASYYLASVSKEGGELEAVKQYVKEQHENG